MLGKALDFIFGDTPDYSAEYAELGKAIERGAKIQADAAKEAMSFQERMWQKSMALTSHLRAAEKYAVKRLQGLTSNDREKGFLEELRKAHENNKVQTFDEWKADHGPLTQVRSAFDYVKDFQEKWNRGERTPGYEFRLREGMRQLARQQSATGTRLSGQAAREVAEHSQEFASNEYDRAHTRAVTEGQLREGNDVDEFNRDITRYGLKRDSDTEARLRAIGEVQRSEDIHDRELDRLRLLAGLGGTGQQLNQLSRHTTQYADTIVGHGDARAAGKVNAVGARVQGRVKGKEAKLARDNAVVEGVARVGAAYAGAG